MSRLDYKFMQVAERKFNTFTSHPVQPHMGREKLNIWQSGNGGALSQEVLHVGQV